MNRWILAIAAALAITTPRAARGQGLSVQPPAPAGPATSQVPRLPSPQVTLADSVRVTLQNNPQIAVASATYQLLEGRAQQARGAFDSVLRINPNATYDIHQVSPFLLKNEQNKRDIILAIGDEFTLLTVALKRIVALGNTAPPRCPTNLVLTFGGFNFTNTFLTNPITVDRVDPSELTLLGTGVNLPGSPFADLLGGITLANLCTNPAVTQLSPELYIDTYRQIVTIIDQSGGLGLSGTLRSVSQIPRESRALQSEITNAIATRARLALERLGPLPTDQFQRTFFTDFTLAKPLRTGTTLTGTLRLAAQDQNFRDKSYDSSFGGMGQPPNFLADASITVDLPIGRGSGRTSVTAPERAAALLVTGQRESARFEVATQAYRASLAYFNLIAAQETLARLQESAARQQQIANVTQGGVNTGDIPRVEVSRARARAERVNSSVSEARAAVATARVSLAEIMGVSADDLNVAPLATETFATVQAPPAAVEALVAGALASRLDIRAFQAQQAASEALAAGARSDLRRTLDVLVTGGMSNIYDSPIYKFLPDELNPIIPPSPEPAQPIHYYSPLGFYRAIQKRWEPYVVAHINVRLPFGNHAAKGRFEQAQANVTSARIEVDDLSRRIRANIQDIVHQLGQSAAGLQQWEAAVRSNEEILQGTMQRFESRDQTLIDTLTTEEAATRDRLELVRQRQLYFSTLARLKFETGDLIGFDPAASGLGLGGFRFDPTVFVGR